MLGTRQPEVYGRETLTQIEAKCKAAAKGLKLELDCFQSNHEGEIVTEIQKAVKKYHGLIINAGAYSHTSIALMDAVIAFGKPAVEVHLSNIFRRESFRRHSYISEVVTGIICGLGPNGYQAALIALADTLESKADAPKKGRKGSK